MNLQKSNLAWNLADLRRINKYSLEEVAFRVGATRQAVAKWENGDSVPDLMHASALAELYGVTLDALLNFSESKNGVPVPPKGKHIFGLATVGERGQIVLPKAARDVFGLQQGTRLVVLGDEAQGIALVEADRMAQGVVLFAENKTNY